MLTWSASWTLPSPLQPIPELNFLCFKNSKRFLCSWLLPGLWQIQSVWCYPRSIFHWIYFFGLIFRHCGLGFFFFFFFFRLKALNCTACMGNWELNESFFFYESLSIIKIHSSVTLIISSNIYWEHIYKWIDSIILGILPCDIGFLYIFHLFL